MAFSSTTTLSQLLVIAIMASAALCCLPRASAENDFAINMLVTESSCKSQNYTAQQTALLWALDIMSVLEARLKMDQSPYSTWVRKCRLITSFYYSTLSASGRLSIPWWVCIFLAGLYLAGEAFLVKPMVEALQNMAQLAWTKLHGLAREAWNKLCE